MISLDEPIILAIFPTIPPTSELAEGTNNESTEFEMKVLKSLGALESY